MYVVRRQTDGAIKITFVTGEHFTEVAADLFKVDVGKIITVNVETEDTLEEE